ncbi:hypothetical protein DICPUDRAFT_39314 [Dictyostelium purpureum]|uniref:Major facilitator superfamily (MFS) profile domain-containing protein n=1 Tax=Dictyostelium purpureum TaxID=5786 RepID=F0ZW47_DICPU|nr:uncharacterized protein DICPUDRAFT_39314 [Dictyostelium purpureum]EGC31836.1 hypothetical protein DICPUDRAFT_39314 [Dictyostelium purpureum]|eukprot:XP_003291637.1 hypothetical protein DICPUDRAFT_39314 [Dictyostelium purpureum]
MNNSINSCSDESDSFSDYEEDLVGTSIVNIDEDKEPLLFNNQDGASLLEDSEKKGQDILEEINKKKSIFQHKYLKDVLLIYALYSLLTMTRICYGLFIPNVMINYVKAEYPDYTPEQLQSKAAYYKSFLDAIPYIFMFLFGPLAGAISDKYGRKVLLYWAAGIEIVDMISCVITIKTNSLVPFFIGHSVAGTTNVSIAAVYSYLADITEEDMVPTTYAMTGMAMGFGIITGPGVYLITSLFPNIFFLTLYMTIGILVFAIIIIIFLKESLNIAKENGKIKPHKKTSNPFKLIKRVFSASAYVSLVICIYIVVSFCLQDIMSTYVYSTALRYGWTPKDTSFFMGGNGFFMLVWSILIVPTLLKYYSERKIISLALLIGFIVRAAYAFAYIQYIWIAAASFGAFVPSSISLLTSVISRATPAEVRGSILTGVQSVGSLAGFLGALTAGNIYSFAISKKSPRFFPGAPYMLSSCILFLAFFGSLIIWKKYSNPTPLRRKRIPKSKSFSVNS